MSDETYQFEIRFQREPSLDDGEHWVGRIRDIQSEQAEFLYDYEDAVRFMKARLPEPQFGQKRQGNNHDAFRGFKEDVSKLVNDVSPQVAAFFSKSVETLSEQAANLQQRMRDSADKARDSWDQNSDKARDGMADLLAKMQQQLDHLNQRLQDLEHNTRKKSNNDQDPA